MADHSMALQTAALCPAVRGGPAMVWHGLESLRVRPSVRLSHADVDQEDPVRCDSEPVEGSRLSRGSARSDPAGPESRDASPGCEAQVARLNGRVIGSVRDMVDHSLEASG